VRPPFEKCVWCDRTDFNVEHIIGQQVAKAMGVDYPVTTFRRVGGQTHQEEDASGEIALEGRVCQTCNGNWMRRLDNKMMKFMYGPIRHGARVQLKQREQAILGFWATKVALLLALWQHDEAHRYPQPWAPIPFVPEDNLAFVSKHHKPPTRTRVWIADLQHPGRIVNYFICMSAAIPGLVDAPDYGYYVVFNLGRVFFWVSGRELAHEGGIIDDNPEPIVPGAMRRIWPNAEQVAEWPPARTLMLDELPRLLEPPAARVDPPEGRGDPVESPEPS
jgi:hypothetical protein